VIGGVGALQIDTSRATRLHIASISISKKSVAAAVSEYERNAVKPAKV
jgi:hypothetical protein